MIVLRVVRTETGSRFSVTRPGRDSVETENEDEVVALLVRLGVNDARQMVADAKHFGAIEIIETEAVPPVRRRSLNPRIVARAGGEKLEKR